MTDPLFLPRVLPRGQNSLPRKLVLVSQRERLLEGVVEAVAAKGYAATTIADIVTRAGVSRATLYEHFPGKDECFVEAYTAGSQTLFDHASAAGQDEPDPVERLRRGTRAYLRGLAAEPVWTRVGLVEVAAAGDAAAARREEVLQWYVSLLRDWHRWARRRLTCMGDVPLAAFAASVHAVNELVASHVRAGDIASLPELEPEVMYIQLALCGFPDEAHRAAVSRKRR